MINQKKYFLKKLQKAQEQGKIHNIDFYCCTLLIPNAPSEIKLIILYLSYAIHWGHSCLPVKLFKKKFFLEKKDSFIKYLWSSIIHTKSWFQCILKSKFCSNGSIVTPLVFQKEKIYLYRYWNSERKIINFIIHHQEITDQKIKKYRILFKKYCTKNIDKVQKIAIGVMLLNNISFILGGPGTGKTSIITYLILLLIKSTKKNINIQLTAPTGKAASRITEVVYQKLSTKNLTVKEKRFLPKKGITLHRLFNIQKNTNEIHSYKYIKKKISNIDLLIIDEASMIDLYMMENISNIIQKKQK
nr:AAA family ATPase [Buchnera aphidicola]